MNKDWLVLLEKYGEQGARQRFERICESLYRKMHSDKNVKSVKVKQGDGGIDVFIGEMGVEPVDVIQCKFFTNFADSQKNQVRNSFNRAIESSDYEMNNWTLCIPLEFDIEQHIWWSNWKKKKGNEHQLTNQFIQVKSGNDLVDLLTESDLYNVSFERTDSLKIAEIYEQIIKPKNGQDIKKIIQSASYSLFNIKNYIENNSSTHLERNETKQIYNWINADLENNQKNVLVLKGEKGMGKSVILKDLYDLLVQGGYYVLGIKADKFYAESISQLETKIFLDGFTFSQLFSGIQEANENLVIIIDQIDALSQVLSSNREYLQTYNRLVSELEGKNNIRVIISSRSYDLEYDAELSVYNRNEFRKVSTQLFTIDEVKSILRQFNIQTDSLKAIELFRTPNHLEIFCKLPNRDKIKLDSISSLKNLYDALWKQCISSQRNPKLKELLFTVSGKMYNEQPFTINNIYNDNYYNEIKYLNSNHLLIEHNNELAFFHQTFYEYCYARQFVENGHILEEFIIQNDQSLYVRSVIKMVSEYLREYDSKKYIQSLSKIVTSVKYRYHIKILLLADLGLIKQPSLLEKQFVIENILNAKVHEELFFYSVNSLGWLNFFLEEDILRSYFLDLEFSKNCLYSFFYRNVNYAPLKILEYVETIEVGDKDQLVINLLTYVEDWSDVKLLDFFNKYLSKDTINKDFWYMILEKIAKYNIDFVFSQLKPIILSSLNKYTFNHRFDYSLNHVINELYEKNKETSFIFLFNIMDEIVEGAKQDYFKYNAIESPLYESVTIFDDDDFDDNVEERSLGSYLVNFIGTADKSWLLSFFEKYKNSNSVSILILVAKGLSKAPLIYKDQSFEFIQILKSKNVLKGSDDEFQFVLRNLISVSYVFFNNSQKEFIKDTLLALKYSYDIYIYTDSDGKRKYSLREFGKKKYLFITALPNDTIMADPDLKKTYQEFQRKFGDINSNKSLHHSRSRSVGGVVGAPLSSTAYKKMNFKAWKKSMLKFNKQYKSKEFLKGGIEEHSRAFKETVKNAPQLFYDFIDNLFDDVNVEIDYLHAGIDGLVESKYNPVKVLYLFKRFIQLDLDRTFTLFASWISRYFFQTKNADMEVANFLSNAALNYDEKEEDLNPDKPLLDSVNSVRGAAINSLMCGVYDNQFENVIFYTIENVINHPLCNVSVKADIVNNLAYLNQLNINRSFDIFLRLTNSGDKKILEYSLNAAQYFNNVFHIEMSDYFDLVLSLPDIHKDAFVFVNSWLNDSINDRNIYDRFVSKGPIAKMCALKSAEARLVQNDMINEKALSVLFEFVNESDKEIIRNYSGIILRKFKERNFLELLSFLKKYVSSKACTIEPNYFLQYLIRCSKNYPTDCLELLSSIDFSISPDIRYRGYYSKEPVQLVLGIYSKLVSSILKDKTKINKCLDVFDDLLKNPYLRSNANQAIEMIL